MSCTPFNPAAAKQTLLQARRRLLDARAAAGHWCGELSSSALATATAVCALRQLNRHRYQPQIDKALAWLARCQNSDGGWGDTVFSKSNLSATLLCWCALGASEESGLHGQNVQRCENWIRGRAGSLQPTELADALYRRYGKDRTFSVPILTACAVTGRLGQGPQAWRLVAPLPFELAALPHQLWRRLRLPVVSYALPALIAIGQVRHHCGPPVNPLTQGLRRLAQARTLELLHAIQPSSGGYLEAIPLTSFVVMSLAACGRSDNEVVSQGIRFLLQSARKDGSWAIDSNLSTWVTTLAINALADDLDAKRELDTKQVLRFLLGQQDHAHPYTHAGAGGWAWTDLPGGVPDGDDTAGALRALRCLGEAGPETTEAATRGLRWLLDLQNSDGGIPTFCRGWSALPFDRSSPDITAHALLAFADWHRHVSAALRKRIHKRARRAVDYLAGSQQPDGSWLPLWFGNEGMPNEENPTYGTARVLGALAMIAGEFDVDVAVPIEGATRWLLSAQAAEGGWGGGPSIGSSIEETAVAVDALGALLSKSSLMPAFRVESGPLESAVRQGVTWLCRRTGEGTVFDPAPIGLYFARLWYFERLYPLIFTVSALQRTKHLFS